MWEASACVGGQQSLQTPGDLAFLGSRSCTSVGRSGYCRNCLPLCMCSCKSVAGLSVAVPGAGCGVCVPRVSTGTRGPKGLCLFSGLIDGPRSDTAPAARRPRRHIRVAPDLPCCVCGVHFPSPSLSSQARSRPPPLLRSLPPDSLSFPILVI